jgi:hypothetical protein
MLNEIAAGFSLWDRFKKHFAPEKQAAEVDSVASRFIRLFDKHGVHPNQIPRFFGHGLTLADVADHEKLLSKLTHEMLQSACELFAVRLKWLEGVDEKIYETHDFYKHPEDYAEFLAQLIADDEHRIIARLVLSTDPYREEDALLVLEEQIDSIDDEPVVRYHVCSGWVNKYWKSRADLTACIAMTLKQHIYIKEWRTRLKIQAFCAGEGFMTDLYHLPFAFERDWLFRPRYKKWHPDQWLYDPKSYLDGVDEEDNNFGITSALERWLYYFDKGYLETGYHRENARAEFAAKLDKYQ